MEIKALDQLGLKNYLQSQSFQSDQNIAITSHRAYSYINNPRLNPEDVLMILAMDKDDLVGYLGLLPDDMYISDSKIHFAWLSCFWIRSDYRGKKLGSQLLHKANETWDGNLMGTDFVPMIRNMYARSGYFPYFRDFSGFRFYFRFDLQTWLPPKQRIFRMIKPLLGVSDMISNFLMNSLNKPTFDDYKSCIVKNIPEDLDQLIESNTFGNYFLRKAEELSWISQFPWILVESTQANIEQERYYFSSQDSSFKNTMIAIKDSEGKVCAFAFLVERKKILKVPYLYFHPEYGKRICGLIHQYILQEKISCLISFQSVLINYFEQNKQHILHKRPTTKTYMCSENTVSIISDKNFKLMDGDGDSVFT
jgi:GNAT superfamily N-acetyltransferase